MDEINEIIKKWETKLNRKLTDKEKELIELTEGEIDLQLGYCPSIYGKSLEL